MTQDTDDRDLYCLHCGYNLRGLPDDPRRCPECAHENLVADLLVPAQRITKALRQLETGPAMATGALVTLLVWLLPLLVVMLWPGIGSPPAIAFALVIAGILACVAAYVTGVRKFRRTCRARAGWTSALWRHHLFGLLTALCLSVFLVTSVVLVVSLTVGRGFPRTGVMICVGVIIVAFGGTWLFGRLAKQSIVSLQRACAAVWAREHETRAKP